MPSVTMATPRSIACSRDHMKTVQVDINTKRVGNNQFIIMVSSRFNSAEFSYLPNLFMSSVWHNELKSHFQRLPEKAGVG